MNWVWVWLRLMKAGKQGTARIFSELYIDGHAARLAGKPVTACPYSPNAIPQIAASWIAGWHDEPLWGAGEGPLYARQFLKEARARCIPRQSRFPFISTLALMYPLGAVLDVALPTSVPLTDVAGVGLANLGYLLFAAGVFSGHFNVFRLKKRSHVFLAAVLSFTCGTLLSNVNLL